MASGLLLLLDDIATILDDVAVLTKVAAKKTAGILGDDLALNAQQVTGVASNRELPVVWAVAKGSFWNKVILIPLALLFSLFADWAIDWLLMLGGTYLCFEGCEKLVHKYLHPEKVQQHRQEHEAHVADPHLDIVAAERAKVRGAIRTDFILSAEIVVITLGSVAAASLVTQLGVLVTMGMLMTIGVYGLVAGIVKLDDLGLSLIGTSDERSWARLRRRVGHWIVAAAPYLMKFLSIAGTTAMFLVGGGILAHGIPKLHHWIEETLTHVHSIEPIGGILEVVAEMAMHAILGIVVGLAALAVVHLAKTVYEKIAIAN